MLARRDGAHDGLQMLEGIERVARVPLRPRVEHEKELRERTRAEDSCQLRNGHGRHAREGDAAVGHHDVASHVDEGRVLLLRHLHRAREVAP